jgi:hypothetical protein
MVSTATPDLQHIQVVAINCLPQHMQLDTRLGLQQGGFKGCISRA